MKIASRNGYKRKTEDELDLAHVSSWNLVSSSSDFRTVELTPESLVRISRHIPQDVSREVTSSEALRGGQESAMMRTTPAVDAS